jgi:hypothetical protein
MNPLWLLLPPVWLTAGAIVAVRRFGNTDAAAWRRTGVALGWPFFLRDFKG